MCGQTVLPRTVLPRTVLLGLACAHAYYLPIQDTEVAYPLVVDADSGAAVDWTSGIPARLWALSGAVRVNDRGVRYVNMDTELRNISGLKGWSKVDCVIRPGTLCEAVESGMKVFPEAAADVVVADVVTDVADTLGQTVAERHCRRHAARTVTSGSDYTISLCDVTQKRFDFVWTNFEELHVRERLDAWPFYITTSVCVIVLIAIVAQNLFYLLGGASTPVAPWIGIAITLAAVVTVFINYIDFWGLVTYADWHYMVFAMCYVGWYVAMWVGRGLWSLWAVGDDSEALPVNVLVGTLLLIVARLYDGIESPYVLPLLALLAARSWYKALAAFALQTEHGAHWEAKEMRVFENGALDGFARASIVLDFALVGITHQYGFRPLFARALVADMYYSALMAVAGLAAAAAVGQRRVRDQARGSAARGTGGP